MKFKLFGDRVLVSYVPPRKGSLWVPEDKDNMYKMGRVIAVGDGKRPGSKDAEIFVKVDELYFFQTNAYQQAQSMFQVDRNTVYLNLCQSELVARMDDNNVSLEKFHTVGDWILLRPYIKDRTTIIIPEAHQEALKINYKVEQTGHTVDLDLAPGVEVVLTHGMAHPLKLGTEEVAFVNKTFIQGIVVDEDEPTTTESPHSELY